MGKFYFKTVAVTRKSLGTTGLDLKKKISTPTFLNHRRFLSITSIAGTLFYYIIILMRQLLIAAI